MARLAGSVHAHDSEQNNRLSLCLSAHLDFASRPKCTCFPPTNGHLAPGESSWLDTDAQNLAKFLLFADNAVEEPEYLPKPCSAVCIAAGVYISIIYTINDTEWPYMF